MSLDGCQKIESLLTWLAGAPYACPNDYQCIFMPSSVSVPGAVGCCNGDGCAFRLSCYDRQQQGRCDKGCQADSRVLKW